MNEEKDFLLSMLLNGLSVEEKDFLLSILLNTQESLDMADSMEYGCLITDLIDKLKKWIIE